MSNPHPTRSKPNKIGRKHSGAPSAREKAIAAKNRAMHERTLVARGRKRKKAIRAYFLGEMDLYP
jgi:hypothetical protein